MMNCKRFGLGFGMISLALSLLPLTAYAQWGTAGSDIYNTNTGGTMIGDGTPLNTTSDLHIYKSHDIEFVIQPQNYQFSSGKIVFRAGLRGTGSEWEPGKIQSYNDGNYTGTLEFYTNGTGIANRWGSIMTMKMVNGDVGIGGIAPLARLHARGGSFLIDGTTGGTPISGAGTRMMFIPSRGAFRAGAVTSSYWDNPSIGLYSTATGLNTAATGDYSLAMGFQNNAAGTGAVALGTGNTATGGTSTALGYATTATGLHATAMGAWTTSSGTQSIAMGYTTTASGVSSTSMGDGTTASGDYSTAMGWLTTSSGDHSIATGIRSLASGYCSTAMGNTTVASGSNSTAMGSSSVASGNTSIAMGNTTVASGNNSIVMGGYASSNLKTGGFTFGDGTLFGTLNAPGNNEFTVRTQRVWFGVNNNVWTDPLGTAMPTNAYIGTSTGAYLSTGGAWVNFSNRAYKTNIQEIQPNEILEAVVAMPITKWSYKSEGEAVLHIGPMAQDFHDAFDLNGSDNTHIATVDADGVALASIQALYHKVRTSEAESAHLRQDLDAARAENAALRNRLERIEQALHLSENGPDLGSK